MDYLHTRNILTWHAKVHRDVAETQTTAAANRPDPALVQAIIDSSDGHTITWENLRQAKALREENAGITSAANYASKLLSIFSRGEPILIMSVMGNEDKSVPVEWFKTWLGEERLPEGFTVKRTTGLVSVHRSAGKLSAEIDAIHAEHAQERRDA
jgi:hypothetical protein